ncbi:MAG TPA: hypothetical protein EYP69_04410 [Bacteroidales bacterium]|nr:hypothetical protein [Bacteroidales bacterium]
MRRILFFFSLVTIFFSASVETTYAQCKSFTKKHCIDKLSPFVYNGQLNKAILSQGDVADLMLTFYPDQDYRIFVCAEEALGNVEFRLYDSNKKLIYNNKTNDYLPFWDFSSTETMQLLLRVIIPEKEENQIATKSGCVSILIGFKEK